MEIILRNDFKKLGERGQIVTVKNGYARNFLIPYGHAVFATKEALEQIERERIAEERRLAERLAKMNELAKSLENSSCTISAQANEEGHLFGSVSATEIVAAFAEDDVELSEDQIILEATIKEIGVYGFQIRLTPDVEVSSKVWVVKE
ncbi:MAG: 50S ribosomal protein L9 [Planctomycetota bacterium]|jgi:large subunit ribosomal protein L9|nr:50S ribosomal protein L9 [Planctomycetota bacterium]MDP7249520.1 50S ribosomal protein L9 [Planctomycetota bacterium]|tara:strand:+ start:10 stop:453 length:444 start_codon:yes stop_codon:yes gene_type:complete